MWIIFRKTETFWVSTGLFPQQFIISFASKININSLHLDCYNGMLQVFILLTVTVTMVCYKYSFCSLLLLQWYVTSIHSAHCYCYNGMLQVFILLTVTVTMVCYKYSFYSLLQWYVTSIHSAHCYCYNGMLQVFILLTVFSVVSLSGRSTINGHFPFPKFPYFTEFPSKSNSFLFLYR